MENKSLDRCIEVITDHITHPPFWIKVAAIAFVATIVYAFFTDSPSNVTPPCKNHGAQKMDQQSDSNPAMNIIMF